MTFTNAGRNEVRDWLAGVSATAPNSIGVGTGTTSATVNDTALGTEVFRQTITAVTSPFLAMFEMVMTTVDATGSSLSEFGLFNNTTGSGDMFLRNTFAPVDKTSAIEIQFESRVEID